MADELYDELFGSSDEEEEEAPKQVQAPATQGSADLGSSSSSSSDSEAEEKQPRKRVTKGGKKKPVVRRERDRDDSDVEEALAQPNPIVGYADDDDFDQRRDKKRMDDSDDEYRGDSEEETRKPKKKKGKAPKESKPKKARAVASSYDDKKKGAVLVDQAVERNKRVRAKDPDDKRIEAICEEVVSTFERAYKEDKIAMERHALATNKLCAIDHLVKLMGNRKVQDTLMEKHQLLRLIKTWIQPIKSNQLPVLGVRSKLIDVVMDLQVEVDQLKESGIGKVIQQLYKHPDEIPPNKQKLKRIIDKWSNQIMNKSQGFRNRSAEDQEEHRRQMASTADPYLRSETSRGVQILRRTGFDFVRMPDSMVAGGAVRQMQGGEDEAMEVNEKDDGEDRDGPTKLDIIRKRMNDLKKKPDSKRHRAMTASS